MPHAIWSGTVSFGLVSIPVSLYAAEQTRELTFHLLDGRDMAKVRQKRVNEVTGEEVPWEEVVKGYELEDGSWVVVTDDDFRAADVEATQTIDILGAVEADAIGPEWFVKPYHLVPMKPGRKAYALLRDTLAETGRLAVARIVIRARQRLAALVPAGDTLVLEILRWPHELRQPTGLELPIAGEEIATSAEREMARTLVESMFVDWDPDAYADTYHDALLALISRKASEGEVSTPPEARGPEFEGEIIDMTELLRKSIERVASRA